jgi:hypothetical protein
MDETTEIHDVQAIKAKLLAKMGARSADYPVHIEQRFPHILANVAKLWGTAELDAYLETLMLPDRDGRQGFPPEVAMEMFHLSFAHAALGLAPKSSGTGWTAVDDVALERKAAGKRG